MGYQVTSEHVEQLSRRITALETRVAVLEQEALTQTGAGVPAAVVPEAVAITITDAEKPAETGLEFLSDSPGGDSGASSGGE